jgi:Domain of unknown function (DUF4410)
MRHVTKPPLDRGGDSFTLRSISHLQQGFTMLCMIRSSVMFALAGVMFAACGGHSGAPTLPDGKKLAVMVVLDRSMPPEATPEKAQQLTQVADAMGPDLVDVLQANGYDAAAITEVDSANEPGRYILKVGIVDYNGGSMAARAFIGWGAGKARLQAAYELFGPGGRSYIKGSPGEATGATDWRRTVRKVNQDIVQAVNVRLRQSL